MGLSDYRYRALVGDKFIVLLDQALLSLINFGSILVLSKIAEIRVFSDFVVTYSYGYFIFILATYLISAPILIFLPKKWSHDEGKYLIVCVAMNFVLNLLLSILLFYFLQLQVPSIPYVYFLLLPLSMTTFELLKKFIFSSRNVPVKYGFYATALLNVLFFGLLLILNQNLLLNNIVLIYALSFLLGGFLIIIFLLKAKVVSLGKMSFTNYKILYREILFTHFHYSKWIILGGIAFWGYTQGIYIVAKYFSISDLMIGKVRTLQNLLGVFSIVLIALENHYTPIFSAASKKVGILGLEKQIKEIFKENSVVIIILFVLAVPIGLFFYNYVYLEKYGDGVSIFSMFLMVQFLLLIIRPFGIALKSIENTLPFFISHLLAAGLILLMLPTMLFFNIENSLAWSITVANFIYVGYIAFYYASKRKIGF